MLFLIDECVPDDVAEYLGLRGHQIEFARDLFATSSPDEIVALGGDLLSAIIVTWDRDFKRFVQRAPRGTRRFFRNLGRISFSCREPLGRKRIEELIESIEFEYAQVQKLSDKRLIVQISETSFTVSR